MSCPGLILKEGEHGPGGLPDECWHQLLPPGLSPAVHLVPVPPAYVPVRRAPVSPRRARTPDSTLHHHGSSYEEFLVLIMASVLFASGMLPAESCARLKSMS